ncbi:hypothetical protein [Streptomyces albus]|uniref:hypothetical protein n=1 Tax=Streptomyces albus TaxID=1888 RepID=UPI0004C6160F|nr:hypothetical protein [Streptomyces albus]
MPHMLTSVRLAASVASVVMIGCWVNFYTEKIAQGGYVESALGLGWDNSLLVLGIFSLVAGESATRRWAMLEHDEFRQRYLMLQQRQRRLLESTLELVCELIAKTLQVRCNARYFVAEEDGEGRYYIRQDRDLAVLNISMPREFGFTRIHVDTPHIVSGRAFRERVPLFQELPAAHSELYDPEVGRMIEPAQRWVLACPVLRLDAVTGSHAPDAPPHGVIVFYGTEVPGGPDGGDRVRTSLDYAQRFAEQMSHMLNMLELSTETEPAGAPVV